MAYSSVTVKASSRDVLALAEKLSHLANHLDVGADRSFVVHVVQPEELEGWQSLPAIWHSAADESTIIVNLGRYRAAYSGARGSTRLLPIQSMDMDQINETIRSRFLEEDEHLKYYRSFESSGLVNPDAVSLKHTTLDSYYVGALVTNLGTASNFYAAALVGTLMREVGYSVFNEKQVRSQSWFDAATPYQRTIIRVLEELRVERQQLTRLFVHRVGDELEKIRMANQRALFRVANIMVSPAGQVISDITKDGETTLPNLALNSSLILGRVHYHLYLDKEVAGFRDQVESYLGSDLLADMEAIWREYAAIKDADEASVMALVKRWEELFPSSADGEGTGSSVADPDDAEAEEREGESGEGESEGDESGEGEQGEGEGAEGDESGEGSESGEGQGDSEGKGEGSGSGSESGEGSEGTGADGESGFDGNELLEDLSEGTLEGGGDVQTEHGTRGAKAHGSVESTKVDENNDADPGVNPEVIKVGDGFKDTVEPGLDAESLRDNVHKAPPLRTPSRESYANARHRKPAKPGAPLKDAIARGREIEPNASDRKAAESLTRVLRNLNTYDRGKFVRAQLAPPGRLNSRGAVQQRAERSLNLPGQARPWKRTVRTVDTNPPLSVGIMTDISGSMGWAEKLTARFTWAVQHAVSTVNGKVAAVSFGDGVTITLRPGERLTNAQVVRADGGSEAFDFAAGTLDTMLNLENGTGARVLVVMSDGMLVRKGEMARAEAWVKALTQQGVLVIWVTHENPETTYRGKVLTPKGAFVVDGKPLYEASYRGNSDVVNAETVKLIDRLGRKITQAVEEAKRNRRV